MCAEARDGLIQMSPCVAGKTSQKWDYSNQQLKHTESGLCLSSPPGHAENMASGRDLIAVVCSDNEAEQKWEFQFVNTYDLHF